MYLEAIHEATGIRSIAIGYHRYNRLFLNSKTEEVTNILLILMILSLLISPPTLMTIKKLGNVINSCRRVAYGNKRLCRYTFSANKHDNINGTEYG